MRNKELAKLIARIHQESRSTYGWQRMHADLVLGLGGQVNRKRVARLMRQARLQGNHRRKGRKNLVNAASLAMSIWKLAFRACGSAVTFTLSPGCSR